MALPFVWKCEESFLVGSQHVTEKNYFKDIEKFLVEKKIKTVVLECVSIPENDENFFLAKKGHAVGDLLTGAEVSKLQEFADKNNLDFKKQILPYSLFWISQVLSGTIMRGYSYFEGQVRAIAEDRGIKIAGLETAAEGYAAVSLISEEEVLKWMKQFLADTRSAKKRIQISDKLYNAGDGDGIVSLYRTAPLPGAIVLVLGRNKVMAERMIPYLLQGNCVVIVGVLHLLDKNSVQYFLAKKGLLCERIIL